MTQPKHAQLDLLLSISDGLSRGSDEMLRVSPTDAMHPPSCSLAIRDAVEELKWLRAEIERQARHIEEPREKIDAEKSCACSYDAPGDVCAAHSPALMQERAENERLRAEIERLREALVLGSEVLASHQGSPQREWHSGGAWLFPGDSINVVRAPLPEIKVEP